MRARAYAGMREGNLLALFLKTGEKVLGVLCLISQSRSEDIRAGIDPPDRFERGRRVIVQVLVEHGGEGDRGVNQQRVAVGRSPRDSCSGERSTGSRQIVDDNRLAELG